MDDEYLSEIEAIYLVGKGIMEDVQIPATLLAKLIKALRADNDTLHLWSRGTLPTTVESDQPKEGPDGS